MRRGKPGKRGLRVQLEKTSRMKNLKAELPEVFSQIRRVIGQRISQKILDNVRNGLPAVQSQSGLKGWVKIYRDSLDFDETDEGFAILGIAPIDLRQAPAETTLVYLLPRGTTTRTGGPMSYTPPAALGVLQEHNPWTVDTLPGIAGSGNNLIAYLLLRPEEASKVNVRRRQIKSLMPQVITALAAVNRTVVEDRVITVNGGTFADMIYLSERLEYGLGGFPRVPHWAPAHRMARARASSWVLDDPATMQTFKDVEAGRGVAPKRARQAELVREVLSKRRGGSS